MTDDGDRAYEASVDRELRGEPDGYTWTLTPSEAWLDSRVSAALNDDECEEPAHPLHPSYR